MLAIYIYNKQDEIVAQYLKVTNFDCTQKLNEIGSATYEVDISEEGVNYDNLKEFTRHRVAIIQDNTEQTIFDGLVAETKANINSIKVTLNDFLYLFKKKKLYSDLVYTSKPIKEILQEQLDLINAREDTSIRLETNIVAQVSKNYKGMTSFYDLLTDLAKSGYEFIVENNVLYFKEKIGIDRTTDDNYTEFKYDILAPQEINISSFEISRNSDNFANAVTATAQNSTGVVTLFDTESIAKYRYRIEEVYNVDGDATSAATSNLAQRKWGITEVEATALGNSFFIANAGDTVAVYINGGNEMQEYIGSARVTQKNTTYAGAIQSVSLSLSTSSISTPTLLDTIKKLNERVKKLEV